MCNNSICDIVVVAYISIIVSCVDYWYWGVDLGIEHDPSVLLVTIV